MIPMKQTPLSQLAVVSAGQSAPKDNEFLESGTPFVRAGSLEALIAGKSESELELVSAETAKLRKLKIYPKGTILFAKSGMSATKDRIYVLQSPAHVVSHLATLIPKDGAHGDYLRLALKRFPPSSLIKDPAYPAIGLREIENFEIPVPEDLDDQFRIANLLGKVEGLIAQRKQHLQQLDDLLKSVFLEMFGDPVRNDKGWETAPIERFCEAVIDCPHSTPEYSDVETGYYCIRSSDVVEGYLDLTRTYQVSKEIFEDRIARYRPQANDIVYSREGGRLGNAARVSGGRPICLGQRMMLFKVNSSNRPEFLWALLESAPFKSKLRGLVGGGAAPRVNIKDLKKLVVVKPGADLQTLFSHFVLRADHLRARYEQSLNDLEALYGALSQQAFKGELDLSRVALPAAPIEVEQTVAAALPAPITTPVIALPETDLLRPALQDRTQLAPLLHFWLEAYRTQLGSSAFSLERFIAAAQTRLAELHPDNEFELVAGDYETIKTWVFEALATGALTQGFDDDGNRTELKAVAEQGLA